MTFPRMQVLSSYRPKTVATTAARNATKLAGLGLLLLMGAILSPRVFGQVIYQPDCNDPDARDVACTEPTRALIDSAQANGYPYYIGHAEPTVLVFSTTPASGNNMQWKLKLPATDPTPNQSGTQTANFELSVVNWVGLSLCDPNSKPYGPCTPLSDANGTTAGSAFLELQFFPPGPSGCKDTSKWCVLLHINTWEDNNTVQTMGCQEPTTAVFLTTNGSPGGTQLAMNNGDTVIVTLIDTANGLQATVNDTTTSTTGSMIASSANGFKHNANLTDCTTTGFDFHAEFATASQGLGTPWANLFPNVAFDNEIGHWELCSDSSCSSPPQEPNGPMGMLVTDSNCGTVRGVAGCFDSELDHDGTSYLPDWPDGSANHPASWIITSITNNGVGPLSAPTSSSSNYTQGYKTIQFETTESTTTAAGGFYPFFSQAGTGNNCVFNFGNHIPGVTTSDLSQSSQYNPRVAIANPCFPASAAITPTISKLFTPAQIALGATSTLSFTLTNANAGGLTGVSFSDFLPAGITVSGSASNSCGGTLIASGGTISLSGGNVPGSGSCSISVTVSGVLAGVYTNTVSGLSSNESLDGMGATAPLTVVGPPFISKAFAALTVPLTQNTTLTFTSVNPNATVILTGVGFNDPMPSGMTTAGASSSGCGSPVITGPPSALNITGISIGAGGTCTITATVTGITGGVKNNLTSNVTSNEGGPGNTASASILVVLPPSITKTFSPDKFLPGGTTTVSFSITNPNTTVALTGVAFIDALPSGLTVGSPNGLTSTCGGTATANAGSGTISLANGSIAASNSCTITATVTAPEGIYNNSVQVTSANGGTGNTATATVFVATPPNLSKVFGEVSILPLSSTTLTFTLMNPNRIVTLDALQFSDTLPPGLVISTPSVVTGSCGGGTIVAPAGSNLITLGSAVLAPQASCTFSVNVSSDGSVVGYVTNTTSTVTSTEALPGAAASAVLFIGQALQVNYSANLNVGESYIDIGNAGTNGDPALGPGFGAAAGNICVNVYAFDPSEELISCCSCLVTPGQTVSLGVNADLTSKTLTGVIPTSVTVKLLSTLAGGNGASTSCNSSAASAGILANGMAAFRTTLHATPVAGSYASTETQFTPATLSAGEQASITGRCAGIIGNASGFGICSSCRAGAQGGAKF